MRKEEVITLNDRGRELTFRIKEMPATKLQRWLVNLAGATVGKGDLKALAQNIRAGSFDLSGLNADTVQPLLNELLTCCHYLTGKTAVQVQPETVDGIIEDVRTLFELEMAAAKVNLYFFDKESVSTSSQEGGTAKPSTPSISMRS